MEFKLKILITIVNYNTSELLAYLLFSLFRIVGHELLRCCDILIVDNNSIDDSKSIIEIFKQQELIKAIFNPKQMYHGPALNQGLKIAIREEYDIFWIIDSDVVVLRAGIIKNAIDSFESQQVDMMAQSNRYSKAHGSCMMLRVSTIKKLQGHFVHGGNVTRNLEKKYRRFGATIRNFPFRNKYYILHVGCGTRKAIKDMGDTTNAWYKDVADCSPWYHGDLYAPTIHNNFKQLFRKEVPNITPQILYEACIKRNKFKLILPKRAHINPRILPPTPRGIRKRAKEAKKDLSDRSALVFPATLK